MTPEHENPELQLSLIREKISHTFDGIIAQVGENLNTGSKLEILTGHKGIGKSSILTPRLERSLRGNQFEVVLYENDYNKDRPFREIAEAKEHSERVVMLVDSATSLQDESIKRILQERHRSDFAVISIIAFSRTRSIPENIERWKQYSTIFANIHELPSKPPGNLLEQYLKAQDDFGNSFSNEQVSFILDTLPQNLRLFSFLRGYIGQDKEEIRGYITQNLPTWEAGGNITPEEAQKIYEKLMN